MCQCVHCQKPVSPRAKHCPHCGEPNPGRSVGLRVAVYFLLLVGIIYALHYVGLLGPVAEAALAAFRNLTKERLVP